MQFGFFTMPSHPPERDLREGMELFGFDYLEKSEAWRHSLELIVQEVAPKLAHLEVKAAA